MKALIARLTPSPLKRAHQHARERRHSRALAPITQAYVTRNGLAVAAGPFAGMTFPPDQAHISQLAGTYELELHDAVADWLANEPDIVVNVGAGVGFYAVGLALATKSTRVHAFDIEPHLQEATRTLAQLNGVEDRVEVGSECTIDMLRGLPEEGVALLFDCEGCELALLKPDLVPAMANWRILVELHDFLHPGLTEELLARFTDTHDVQIIDQSSRDGLDVPPVAFLSARERHVALDEYRPLRMSWAHLRPRPALPSGPGRPPG